MTTINTVAASDDLDTWRTTLNAVSTRWNALGTADAIDISGGSIDGTPIGVSTASTGVFTDLNITSTLDIRSATLLLDNNSISGDKISGGTVDCQFVELAQAPSSDTHATRKDYVDGLVEAVEGDSIAFAIVFGG